MRASRARPAQPAGAAEREGLEALKRIVAALGGPSADSWRIESAAAADEVAVATPGVVKGGEVMSDKVRREDGKVWIEGMEEMNWGGSFFRRQDSQVACLTEVLRCTGQDLTYADVMGLSGCAFKLTMGQQWAPHRIHSEFGLDWPEIMQRVFGLSYDFTAISFNDEENPEWRSQLREAVVASVDRGMPVFYMNGEWNLIVGYREDGSALICKPYAGDQPGYQEMAKPSGFLGDAWFASVLEKTGEPGVRRDAIVKSLQTAAELANAPSLDEGQRLCGFAAYEAWIDGLEKNKEGVSLHGNAFCYSQLLTSRAAAAEYLRKVADELGDEAAPHLKAAADHYTRISERLWDGRDCVKHPWEESWTPENRAIEARIMRESLADERDAVAEIAEALAALGVESPPGATEGGV